MIVMEHTGLYSHQLEQGAQRTGGSADGLDSSFDFGQ